MLDKIFNDINFLEKGLDAAWMRNQVISNNIANVDTPNFKSSKVEFESIMKSALETEGFAAKCKRSKHISLHSQVDDVSPVIIKNSNTTMRTDGNNVDIDYENTELAKNTIYYEILIEKVSSEFSRLKMAINEGK
ncbi:MAG: flagellar basal body rod protein FlgB [Christensenellales bacterium]